MNITLPQPHSKIVEIIVLKLYPRQLYHPVVILYASQPFSQGIINLLCSCFYSFRLSECIWNEYFEILKALDFHREGIESNIHCIYFALK